MPVVKKVTEESVKRGRGRPKGSTSAVKPIKPVEDGIKRGKGRPKGSTNADKEVLYTFTCPTCGWTATSGIKTALVYCPKDYNRAMPKVKKGK
jgi:hypothetical protein